MDTCVTNQWEYEWEIGTTLEDLASTHHFWREVPKGTRSMSEHALIIDKEFIEHAELLRAERNGEEMA